MAIHEPPAGSPGIAALLTTGTAAFAAGSTLMAKTVQTDLLGPALSPLQASFARFLFAFVAVSMAVLVLRPHRTRPAWRRHMARSAFGWGGVTLMFAAAALMPLSDATAISFLNPVFAMLLAIPLLGENVGRWRWAAAMGAILGALILLRPTAGAFQPAALLALGAAILFGAELILIKRLAMTEAPLQVLWINNAFGLALASVAVVWVWTEPTAEQWLAMAAIGVLMALAQACFVNAAARADASFVAPFFYAAIAFAALYDWMLFGVLPDAIGVAGAAVILVSALVLTWREARQAAPRDGL